MNRLIVTLLGLLLVTACGGSSTETGEAPAGNESLYFFGGRIIPGDGSAPIEEATMLVQNGKITGLGGKGEVPPPDGAGRVDLAGMTVMPAIINGHGSPGLAVGQSYAADNYKRESVMNDLNRYAYYGISTVATMGTDADDTAFMIRDEQRQGTTGGAKLLTAGRGITVRGGYPSAVLSNVPIQVANANEGRRAVAELAGKNVDFVSIWVDDTGRAPKMGPDIFTAIIDEAHKNNLKVMAHVVSLADAKALVNAGVDALVNSVRDREVDDELIGMMKQRNTFYMPTLTTHEAKFVYADRPEWLGEQTMREVYPAQLSAYLADTVTVNRFRRNPELAQLRQHFANATRSLKKMADAGVKIAFGSGSGSQDTYPGYFEHRELELMVAAGMSPSDTIKSATSVAAEALGLADVGTLATGKAATFIVLSANPLEEISGTQQLVYLYIDGKEIDRRPLIQNIQMPVTRITESDRAQDRAAELKAAQERAEAAKPHYGNGKFTLGSSTRVRGLAVPTPNGSRTSVQSGASTRITVAMAGAAAGDLRAFYTELLPQLQWQSAQGGCFQRPSPVSQKNNTLCIETSAGQAVVTVTEQ
jgi:imidazolonepropionase-like amidohydrolase